MATQLYGALADLDHTLGSIFARAQHARSAFERARHEEHAWRVVVALLDDLAHSADPRTMEQTLQLAQAHLAEFDPARRLAPAGWIERARQGCARAQRLLTLCRHASLSFAQLGPQGFESLVMTPGLGELTILRVDDDVLSTRAMSALARSGLASTLRELHLNRVELEDEGVRALMTARWPRLQVFSLSGNALADGALIALCEQPRTPRLLELYLDDNQIQDAGVLALAYSRGFEQLERLSLYGNAGVSDLGAQALHDRLHSRLLALMDVELSGCGVCASLRAKLARACQARW